MLHKSAPNKFWNTLPFFRIVAPLFIKHNGWDVNIRYRMVLPQHFTCFTAELSETILTTSIGKNPSSVSLFLPIDVATLHCLGVKQAKYVIKKYMYWSHISFHVDFIKNMPVKFHLIFNLKMVFNSQKKGESKWWVLTGLQHTLVFPIVSLPYF